MIMPFRARREPRAAPDEVLPLREGVAYMGMLRFLMGGVVIGAAVFGVVRAGEGPLVLVTLLYLVLSLWPVAVRGMDPTKLWPLARGMLYLDCLFLAWVLLETGGPFSPLRYLLFLDVIVVTLLVSHRIGVKVAAWQTLLLLTVAEASSVGFGVRDASRSPDEATVVLAVTIAAIWVLTLATAAFSAVNERALRLQNAQLRRLAAMTEELDQAATPSDVPDIVLAALRDLFGFSRGVVMASAHDDLQVLGGMDARPLPSVATGLDPVLERAWLRREPTLVRRIDPAVEERLGALLPGARNVLIVPLFLPKGYRLGLIVLEYAKAHGTMRRSELLMIEQFAAHAALSMHNAWLTEERAARLEEVESLQHELVAHNARLETTVAERTEQLRATIDDLEEVDLQRRHLLQGLVRAQEDERTRLANDIHDDPLQKLVSIKMRVELLQREGAHLEELSDIHEILHSCLISLRFMLFDLRPPILDERGLAPALERFVEQAGMDAAVAVRDEMSTPIDPDSRVILYRIAQEALTNVKKHAMASHVEIVLTEQAAGVAMTISDDGVGFLPSDIDSQPGHLGLGSMRERADMAGGRCALFSLPGSGTTLEVWVPPVAAATSGAPGTELEDHRADVMAFPRSA